MTLLFLLWVLKIPTCHCNFISSYPPPLSHEPVVRYRMAIVLGDKGGIVGDLAPAIDLAVERSGREFGIEFEALPYGYVVDSVLLCDELKGLRQVMRALHDSVDVILGPACTPELVSAAKLTTITRTHIITGAGSFINDTEEWPYTIRLAFNTGTISVFVMQFFLRFHWSTAVVVGESDSHLFSGIARGPYKCN